MNIEALNLQNLTQFQPQKSAVDANAKEEKAKDSQPQSEDLESKQIQPEELLQQIKSLTEDGLYSVRFESNNDANELIVKVVNSETNEVIRQIPPEELLTLTQRLTDLRGNLVDTET